MVQTLRSITILAGQKIIMFEKPRTLNRIFFSIQAIAPSNECHKSKISFDDPSFLSFYVLDCPTRYFESKGEGIFQGNIWVYNTSDTNLLHTATEILV